MFAKVFASLWDGTLADHWETWSVFVFMLAHSNANGVVDMTPQAISRRSCIPLDKVEAAIRHLSEPDPRSRTAEEQGRRLVLLDDHRDWGWRIVNYEKYRNMRDEEGRREQNREAKARQRERESVDGVEDADMSADVSTGQHMSASVSTRQHESADVSIGQHPSASVSTGQPKQKQKQKQRQKQNKDKTGLTALAVGEPDLSGLRDPVTAAQLADYLRVTGTTAPHEIEAIAEHREANDVKAWRAYYDRCRPYRNAIVMRVNLERSQRENDRLKRATS